MKISLDDFDKLKEIYNTQLKNMTTLKHYLQDGAHYQARAVLAFLQRHEGIEASWSAENKCYTSSIKVARWENCREQGYIVAMEAGRKQINIAFFEHRNSDGICAVEWEQSAINSITIGTAQFGGKYKDKYDTDYSVPYGEVSEMADWIWGRLEAHWTKNNPKKEDA